MSPRADRADNAAVMQRRHEPADALDFFPTPPWATRAFMRFVLKPRMGAHRNESVWEPACGEGHMAGVLAEGFNSVTASDIFDYGFGLSHDFLGTLTPPPVERPQWIITNPPFNQAVAFARRALDLCWEGCALLVRTGWLHSEERWELFQERPPRFVAHYAERVPMHRGRWVTDGSSATDYSWVCWSNWETGGDTTTLWIPPGQRRKLTLPDDAARFGGVREKPAAGHG